MSGLVAWPCSQLPEFNAMLRDAHVREAFLAEIADAASAREGAAAWIRQRILVSLPYGGESSQFVSRLRSQGIDEDCLSNALAEAWLEQRDCFFLPRPRKRDFLRGAMVQLVISAVAALVLMATFIGVYKAEYHDFILTLLAIEPLLALIGVALTIIIFKALRQFS